MSVWTLEWLRLVRTRRLVALLGVYLFFGLIGPLTARYMEQILGQIGTDGVEIVFPPPVPADGIIQYVSNSSQIGLLVAVLIASSALAFDARREMAVFLRTRVPGVAHIILPSFTVNAAAASGAFVLGSLAAWYETVVLIGPLPAAAMGWGMALGVLFLFFVVGVVALMASLTRSVLATAGSTLVGVLAMAIVGGIGNLGRWLPTHLAGALPGLVTGAELADYLPAAAVAASVTAVMLVLAVRLSARREL